MRKLIVLFSFLVLTGCAGGVDIEYIVVDRETLTAIAGPDAMGAAEIGWKRRGFEKKEWCYIYIMAPEVYPSIECYEAVLSHEERHCDEGHWHDPTVPYIEPVCQSAVDEIFAGGGVWPWPQ